jgi:transcriptional regulator with XRE-family HTH domain
MWRKEEVVEELEKDKGDRSLRDYAAAVGCSVGHLSDVFNGKRPPSEKLLDHLDLERERVVTYTYVKRKGRWK